MAADNQSSLALSPAERMRLLRTRRRRGEIVCRQMGISVDFIEAMHKEGLLREDQMDDPVAVTAAVQKIHGRFTQHVLMGKPLRRSGG